MPSGSRSPMRYPLRHGATCWSLGASAELSQRGRPRALPPPGGWARPLSASKQAPARPARRSPPNPAARAHPAPGGRFYRTRGEPASPGLPPAPAAWSPVGAAVHARTRPPRLPSCPRVPAYRVPPAPQAPGWARSRSLGAIHSFIHVAPLGAAIAGEGSGPLRLQQPRAQCIWGACLCVFIVHGEGGLGKPWEWGASCRFPLPLTGPGDEFPRNSDCGSSTLLLRAHAPQHPNPASRRGGGRARRPSCCSRSVGGRGTSGAAPRSRRGVEKDLRVQLRLLKALVTEKQREG